MVKKLDGFLPCGVMGLGGLELSGFAVMASGGFHEVSSWWVLGPGGSSGGGTIMRVGLMEMGSD